MQCTPDLLIYVLNSFHILFEMDALVASTTHMALLWHFGANGARQAVYMVDAAQSEWGVPHQHLEGDRLYSSSDKKQVLNRFKGLDPKACRALLEVAATFRITILNCN